jgi:hypothetical protein
MISASDSGKGCGNCGKAVGEHMSIWRGMWGDRSFILDLENGRKEICLRNLEVIATTF